MKKFPSFAFIFWFSLFGLVAIGALTYGTPYISDAYAGSGAVVAMVNPNGVDPNRDMIYSDVNQNNANANLTNSYAYQRNSTMWLLFLVLPMILGIIILFLKIVLVRNLN